MTTHAPQLEAGLKPQSSTGQEPPVVGDQFLCCSIFVWAKVFAVLAAIETVLRVGQAMVGDSDSSASLPAAVVITLVTCPFVVPLVINAFYWHRSIIYIVYVVYQSVIVVIIFLALVWMAVSTKCIDQPKCVGTVAKLAILCAWEVLPIYVFWKAAQSQKRNECYDMK